MPVEAVGNERLDSWKEIAAHLGRNERTVVRWEKERGLPVHRVPGGLRRGVFAYRKELDGWLAGVDLSEDDGALGDGASGSVAVARLPSEAGDREEQLADRRLESGQGRFIPLVLGAFVVLAALLGVGGYARYRYGGAEKSWVLVERAELSNNGKEKRQLVLGGGVLYFGEKENGRYGLAAMPASGGEERILWSPAANAEPIAISPDGSKLVVTVAAGDEEERELWIYPLPEGPPHRLSTITAHAAAWAPDGELIAFASGDGVYLIGDGQATPRLIGKFAHNAMRLQWSADGSALRFLLMDNTNTFVGWGELSGAGLTTATIHPLATQVAATTAWAPGEGEDSLIFAGTPIDSNRSALWEMRFSRRWWGPSETIAPVSRQQILMNGLALDRATRQIYVVRNSSVPGGFKEIDSRTKEATPILPGITGAFLDYSPNREWVSYSTLSDLSLWMSKVDGKSARQLTFPPEVVELARWSPDGKHLAFMKSSPGHPWRIYIQDLAGGAAREASAGDDGQGGPSWSPDGKYIAYGGVVCERSGTCAIHRIEVATGRVETLPGSEGLFTARWSPDGRWIAAIHLNEHQLMLFDVKAWKWQKLADGMTGDDLSWASDSRSLYANIHGPDARIVRIRVPDGAAETVYRPEMSGRVDSSQDDDLQFSLTPDDSLVLHNRVDRQEIYAYEIH